METTTRPLTPWQKVKLYTVLLLIAFFVTDCAVAMDAYNRVTRLDCVARD